MKNIRSLVVSVALGALPSLVHANTTSPLDTGNWYQVARMADGDPGVFDGNGDLQSTYSFGTYTSENQSTDFARTFTEYAGMDILFITGNGSIWALSDYATLRATIDDRVNATQSVNFRWDATSANAGGQDANILSRSGNAEDPWISFSGTHSEGVNTTGIIWGENNWGFNRVAGHDDLKNANGGVNVWVSLPAPVPLPASAVFLGFGVAGLLVFRRKVTTS